MSVATPPAARPDHLTQPVGDRPAAGADLQAVPAGANAGRQQVPSCASSSASRWRTSRHALVSA